MTVSNLLTKNVLSGNGNTRVWTYTFDFNSDWSDNDIKIYTTDLYSVTTEITSNFTIDKINKTVTYPTIISGLPLLVTGEKITIARKLPLVQTTSFLNQGAFPSEAIEDTSDKPILILQETNERLDRCITKDIATNNLDISDIKSMTFIDGSTQLTAGVGSCDNLSNNNNVEITMNVNNSATNPKISFNNYNSEVASIDENGNFIGNSATTTKLKTAVNIAGKSFDGNTSITIASTDLSDTSNISRLNTTNSFSDITDSSSSITGAIKTAGGMGIAKKLFVGDRIQDKTGYLMPVGSLTQYAGATAPTGFLICDGSAISRTTYADLFAIISTTYGAGDTTTTFNLPDMRETYAVGVGTRGSGVTQHDVFTLGQFKDDQFQSHLHNTLAYQSTGGGNNAASATNVNNINVESGPPVVDGANGTPRTGTTTRGKAIGLNYIIKY